ncbi:LolA-related protein [Thiohalophilus sp.]|uniref:LolA-related protein n=1 Tax=Thiohalophilus sp. TaxID=3028392 RepID=UPI002ACEB154|nr:LolA-related protein [Thiohalophilus sp.]MDZ7663059.1 LolA-related protein [Thiohalophilus sp.]
MIRSLLVIVGIACSCLAQADFLDQKLVEISSRDELSAKFVDIWRADYLDEDIVSRGNLHFKKPDTLIKKVTEPEKIIYTVSNDTVKIEKDNETKHIKLSEHPDLAVGIYALRALLQGNRAALDKIFLHQLRYSDERFQSWTLELFPKSSHNKQKIEQITVTGNKSNLQKLKVYYANGDTHVTLIEHHD